jgi:hypothetical protein
MNRLYMAVVVMMVSCGMALAFGFGGGGGGGSVPDAQPGVKGKGTADGTSITVVDGVYSATGIAVPISIQPYSNISTALKDPGAKTVLGINYKTAFGNYSNGSLIRGIADPGNVEYIQEITDHANACSGTLRHGVICFDRQASSGGASALTDLTDVSVATPLFNQFLVYNGTDWLNVTRATIAPGTFSNISTLAAAAKTASSFSTYSGNRRAENIVNRFVNFSTNHATGGSMVYPSAGIAYSTGLAWGTSFSTSTSIGTPGVDTKIPTEKAVRDAITAGSSGVSSIGVSAPITSSGSAGSPTIGLASVPFSNNSTAFRGADVKVKSLAITGTAGAGFITLVGQSSNPSSPAAGTALLHAATTNGFTRPQLDNEATTNAVITRDNIFIVNNNSGGTINKGQIVYINGVTGSVPTVAKARANSSTTMAAVCVMVDNVSDSAYNQCMTRGILSGFDTSAFSGNDTLYVSTATAGAFQSTRPSGTSAAYVQKVGKVLTSNVSTGSIMVEIAPFVGNMETGTVAATWTGNAVTATTYNGNTLTTGSSTYTGTAGQTYTMPSTSKTLAANDGSNLTISGQAIGDIAVASSTTAYGKVAAVAVGQVLTSNGTGAAPVYSANPLLNNVDYPIITNTALASTTINLDGVSARTYQYSNGTTAASYTTGFTARPASEKVRDIILDLNPTKASGVITMTWTGVTWRGTAGAVTTTASKASSYICEVGNSTTLCSIISEAY